MAGYDLGELKTLYYKGRMKHKASYKKGRHDSIELEKGRVNVLLHGHHIATYNLRKNKIAVSNAGWATPTTKQRLNKLLPMGAIRQKNYAWYYEPHNKEASRLMDLYGEGKISRHEYGRESRRTQKRIPFKNWMSFKI